MTAPRAGPSQLGAIAFAVAGFTFWVFADTAIKLVGQSSLPPYEMVGSLGLVMAIVLWLYAAARGELASLRPRRPGRQLARASLDMANNVCVVVALRHMTLTLFYVLIFMAPLAILLLSALFLREALTPKKALAVAAGFLGVLLAVHPSSGRSQADWIGIVAVAVCVGCFSVNMVWSRVLTRTETPESLAFFSGVVTAAAGLLLMLIAGAQPLTPALGLGVLAMGLFCALGTLCFYIAVKHTSAANVAQYHYTQLITGTLVSYGIWHNRPGPWLLAGAALILGAGLYVAVSERGQGVPLTDGI